jgi:hypothetical protein
MQSSTKVALLIAAIIVILVVVLLLSGGMGAPDMMGGTMMGGRYLGGFGWMWLPILLVVFVGAGLISFLIRKK